MYETEFTAALQAISENLTEDCFNAIVEAADTVLTENPEMPMDEAVHVAAATMFNNDVIDEAAFGVVDAVMNEFVNRPISYQEALQAIAENCTEEEFNDIMTEAVTYALNEAKGTAQKRDEAIAKMQKWGEKVNSTYKKKADKAAGKELVNDLKADNQNLKSTIKQVKDSGGDAGSKAAAVTQLKDRIKANKKDIKTVKNMADPNRGKKIAAAGVIGAAGAALAGKSIYDKVKHGDALYTAKKVAAAGKEAGQKAVEAGKEAGQKALDAGKGAVNTAREKLSAKNESATGVYTLADLRAMAE